MAKAEEIESQKQIQYTSSSSDTMDSYSSPQKQFPSYGVLGNMENSTNTADHSFPQAYNSFASEGHQSSLPKLLFAEWLSLDHIHDGISANSSDPNLVFRNNNGFDQNPSFQEAAMPQGSFGGEFHNSVIHNSATEMINPQIKLGNQITGNGFTHYPWC